MAGLFASLAVRRALDTLTSFLPASLVASSSSGAARAREEQDLEDLRMLERTMRRIHATLNDAEQLWDIREETTKLQLKELKELAYDMEDVVDEYEYEVNRCKVEALELSASAASNKRKHQTIHKCPNLSVVGSLPSLTTINLKDPQLKDEALYSLLNVIDHPSLNCITIICETMADLNLEPQRLSSLKKLRLCCPNLQYCHGLSDLTFLEEIKIWGCPNLPTDGLLQRLQQSLDVQKNAGVYDVAHAVCDVYSF